ncbi:hypothetical protein BDF20DRAFT_27916 [Mycotypha africana]|uniref:uncharacterized protein n=1 Tax=Mycotypha africana TaxID=64632 RepID=UPI002301406E|nr:uncharacterized protein BDF20DRAFT_27916 [Mycotypha africana]KAI8991170.1 hypothetical protein BDF20DRAFT_27916 [Mycotypha africana]
MVLVLLIPQWINDLDPNKRNAFHVRNRVLLLLHDIQSGKNKSVYAGVQKTILSWTLRTLQFPVLQPSLWTFCFVFLLALLSLPWFYAEFIPSSHRMGYFYLWGILFKDREGDQWIPLDTWLYAIFHILFSVGVFLFVFIWKSEDPSTSHCLGSSSSNSTQENHPTTAMCDRGWVQLLLLAFCLYRLHGVSYLARYYGGGSIYPVLVWNVWVVWWGVVAGVLLLGRRGGVAWWWRGHTRIRAVVQQQPFTICPACQQDTSRRPAESFPLDPVASPTLAASSSSSSSERDEKENEHGPRMEPKARETTMTVDQEPLSIQQQDTIVSEHGMYPAAAALNRRSPAAHLSFLKNE